MMRHTCTQGRTEVQTSCIMAGPRLRGGSASDMECQPRPVCCICPERKLITNGILCQIDVSEFEILSTSAFCASAATPGNSTSVSAIQ